MRCFLAIFAALSAIVAAAQPAAVSALADTAKAYDEAKRLSAKGALAKSVAVLSPIIEELEKHAEASTTSNTLKAQILKLQGDNFMQIGLIDRTADMYQRALKAVSSDSAPLLRADLQNAMFAVYYRRNEYERARDIIDEAIAASRRANDRARLRRFTNNLGLAYAKSNMTDSALIAFDEAISYSSASDDNLPIYINIADTHFSAGDLKATESILTNALKAEHNESDTLLQAMLNLSLTRAIMGKRDESRMLLRQAIPIVERSQGATAANAYEQIADICLHLGDSIVGLRAILKFHTINDSINSALNDAQLEELLVQYDTERLQQRNDNLKLLVENHRLAIIASAIIACLLVLLLIVLVSRMRQDRKKNLCIQAQNEKIRQLEALEHQRQQQMLNTTIDRKNRELTSFTMNHEAVNELHKKLARGLADAVDALPDNPGNSTARNMVRSQINALRLFSDSALSDDFRVYFDEVHPNIVRCLSARYPNLTPNDTRLCAFIYLGLSTKEISALTSREVRSVESSRLRLRRKLDIPSDMPIKSFIDNLVAENSADSTANTPIQPKK